MKQAFGWQIYRIDKDCPERGDVYKRQVDSLRFYYLGNKYETKVEHVGVEKGIAADQVLLL